jgi:hypothetical protein
VLEFTLQCALTSVVAGRPVQGSRPDMLKHELQRNASLR